MIFLVGQEGQKRTTVSYARYLMSVELGRCLLSEEHVDHIDDDRLNDTIDNLQILSPAENTRKGKKRTMVQLQCDQCGKQFERRKGNDPASKGYARAFCSRRCLGVSWQQQTATTLR